MGRSVFLIALLGFVLQAFSQQDTVALFRFEPTLGLQLREQVTGKRFQIITAKASAEYVKGVNGVNVDALRTDGYSTWIATSLSSIVMTPVINITGWFALETYPTDTAGFFALKDQRSATGLSACIDRFGTPMIGFSQGDAYRYIAADTILHTFQWLHIGLNVLNDSVEMTVDGKKVISARFDKQAIPGSFDSLLIGRDERTKLINIFPVNAINGIIGDVVVKNTRITEEEQKRINSTLSKAMEPDLAIPAVRFKDDFNRPEYHLLPSANWTNETHGFIYYKNRYHIFNQKNGSNLILRQINWGHFSSPDLVHWKEHRPVLTPQKGYDQDGIWSGHCIINDQGVPLIVYTGGKPGQNGICMAYTVDNDLLAWKKYRNNPLIDGPPPGYSRKDLRDPFVWREANHYYMIVGYGLSENGVDKGAVLLYKSRDLKDWQFVHPLFVGNPGTDSSGIFWEMPVFRKMKNKYILLVNKVPEKGKPANALYWTGDFSKERFIPDNKQPRHLEVINRMLSPSVTTDAKGNTTAMAIIPDLITPAAQYRQGWTHVYSIPRVWTLRNGKICQRPHPALAGLRGREIHFPRARITAGRPLVLSNGRQQVEVKATIYPGDCRKFGFIVGKGLGNKEFTAIYYDYNSNEFVVDQTHSTLRKDIPHGVSSGKYILSRRSPVDIHLFIDGSVIEVFINNEDAFTTRIFPLYKESDQVELFAEGGHITIEKVAVWEIKNAENKTSFSQHL